MIELWSLNRVLRWTGFRVVIGLDTENPFDEPKKIGLKWVGLYGSKGWLRWEPDTKPFWQRVRPDPHADQDSDSDPDPHPGAK